MVEQELHAIFKKGSKTYFYSTMFFPREVKDDIFRLYSFVRVADDLVDVIPQNRAGFLEFCERYRRALKGEPANDLVIDSFVDLSLRKGFEAEWAEAFLRSMEMDLHVRSYRTLDDLKVYLYGSAEVIGLFMSRIMGLTKAADHYARMLGRAMQYINFIRDINEDLTLGRQYFPEESLQEFGLPSLKEEHARADPKAFRRFIRAQLCQYCKWQGEALRGFHFIPWKYRLPIMTASDMYNFTAMRIMRDPFVVYRKKVKPSIPRIMTGYALNRLSRPQHGQEISCIAD
ncbi:MAG: phytoene/squalene synthase family protein [Methanomassiliicoccales archaeon]